MQLLFGNTTLESLKKYQVDEQVAQWLRAFDAISVRDDNSRKIVQELTGKDPVCHLDPVLVYDYPANLPETKAKDSSRSLYDSLWVFGQV